MAKVTCDWCGVEVVRERWAVSAFCSGRCRTANHRAKRKTTPEALAAALVAEAERVEVLAGQARNTSVEDAPYIGQMLNRLATKLRDTAGMVNPEELF